MKKNEPWRNIYHDTEILRPKTATSRFRDEKHHGHQKKETVKPRHRDSKAFCQRTKSHDFRIPRLRNNDIKILRLKR